MKATQTTRANSFESVQTTPYNRIVGLSMFTLNLIPAIFAIPALAYGMFTVVLIPVMLILGGAGYTLFYRYWMIYKDNLHISKVRTTWWFTILFNAAGLAFLGYLMMESQFDLHHLDEELFVAVASGGFQTLMIILAHTAIRDLDKLEQSAPQNLDIA
ncbi:MAG: hypothetical protein AAGI38_00280 [Bacteroidota bacterium]